MKNLVIAERSYIRKVVFSSKSVRHVNCAETKKPPYGEIRRKKGVCVVAADWGKSAALSAFRRI